MGSAMEQVTAPEDPDELALQAFLANLPEDGAVTGRTLAHGWQAGGGGLQVGQWAIRLLGPTGEGGAPFTAGTIHRPNGDVQPRLELCRVILQNHGIGEDAWTHWSDEAADLAHHGFAATDKFPTVSLGNLTPPEAVRLALGLRDLARMCKQ